MPKLIKCLIACCLMFSALPCLADFTYEDLKKLPRLPEKYNTLPDDERFKWLHAELAKELLPIEKYRLERVLFFEYYFAKQKEAGVEICEKNKPLREDLYYRELCIEAIHPKFEDYLPPMLELIHDARQSEMNEGAAQLLTDLAWRQSQSGDIAGAYGSYETALAIAPTDNIQLLNTIMMDTATNYIVHGDKHYVHKGIDLLNRIREQSQQALNNPDDTTSKAVLKDNIQLTNFNTGIAYTLHLYDYEKALSFFDKLNNIQSPYTLSALSFSALAAAELDQVQRAKSYLSKVAGQQDENPIIDHYLTCYRQLAKYHWNKEQPVSNCLTLDPETTIEVQLDVYKRLADDADPTLQVAGLKKLKALFMEKLEPQLHSRGSQAASNTELRRLQRESELKSVVLKQQKQLQQERDATHETRQKFFLALFVLLVSFILLVASQLRQKKKLAEQFERMSIRDTLTKLGNRRFLEQQIERELAYINRAIRTDKSAALGIYLFDIDHFKKINDTYGHQAGDEVLVELSRRVTEVTRDTDLLARWGGEEFVYIARLDTNDRAYQLADRLLKAINGQPFTINGNKEITVTCTIGVVKYPFIETDSLQLWTRLISLADAALYYGKLKQRNCWVVINNENVIEKEQLDELLKNPLEQSVLEHKVTIKTSFD